jgi:hypothetical protein
VELIVVIDPLIVEVLSVIVSKVKELSMTVVVHASKVLPETVIVKVELGESVLKLGLLDDMV